MFSGTRNADVVKEGKLHDVRFNLVYITGTYQLNGASFSNERDGEIPTVTPLEVTLEDIVTLPNHQIQIQIIIHYIN